MLLVALFTAGCTTLSTQRASAPHAVLLVSIDGLRADEVGSGRMPTLDRLAAAGVQADWMTPSYPTLTFPNHYTLVTGLRPDHHGIVNNTMHDPVLGKFSLGRQEAVEDPRWWAAGEPLWVTLQNQGGIAATMFWPGSEAAIAGQHPRYWHPFDAKVTAAQRVDQVLTWLDLPDAQRPGFITLYFDHVDHAAHVDGPHSAGTHEAMREVDAALQRLLAGLDVRGLRERIDLVVVSDHGMAEIPGGHAIVLDDFIATEAFDVVTLGAAAGLEPAVGDARAADALLGRHDHFACWRKHELPPRWHYGTHPRIPSILCQADVGWELTTRERKRPESGVHGRHGFAPESVDMRAVFIAIGPDFATGKQVAAFDNVDVYPLLTGLLAVPAQANDGDLESLLPALSESGRARLLEQP